MRRQGGELQIARGQGDVGIGQHHGLGLDVEAAHIGLLEAAGGGAVAPGDHDGPVFELLAGAGGHRRGAGALDHPHAARQHGVLGRQQGVPARRNARAAVEMDAPADPGSRIEIAVVGRIDRVHGRDRGGREPRHDGVDLPLVRVLIAGVSGEGVGVEPVQLVAGAAGAGDEFIGVDVAAAAEVHRGALAEVEAGAADMQHP